MSATIAEKAATYLLERRVKAIRVERHSAVVEVTGTAPDPYTVVYAGGQWRCDCPARVPECAHVVAAQAITVLTNQPEASGAFTIDPNVTALLTN